MQQDTTAHEGVAPDELDDDVEVEADLPVTTGYRIANQVAAVVSVLLGAWMTWSGLGLGLQAPNGTPGPGLFPLAIGVLFAALGVAWFVLASLGRLDRSGDTQLPDRQGARRILITAIATAVFLWALLWIGYLLAMTLYVLALLVLVGDRRWVSSAVIAAAFGAGSYFAFTLGLGLPLPHAAIPFLTALGL